MSEMIKRYTIKRGPMMEYQVYDNARTMKLIDTQGLCEDEQGQNIAKEVCRQAIMLLEQTHRPTRKLRRISNITGTGETLAIDDDGNELILNTNDEIVSINDDTVDEDTRSYYHRVYGVKSHEPERTDDMRKTLKGLFR